MAEIDAFLKDREESGLLRRLRPAHRRKNGRIFIGSKEYIDLSSNDYLGLASHPGITEAAKAAIDRFGASSSASRLLSGDLGIFHELEELTASFKGKEAALVFNSGYQANLGVISALYSRGDAIFSDRLNHASIIDGILLSGAKLFRFHHNDMNHLESLLKKGRGNFEKALIVTETIFSMDGDRPDLKALAELKERYSCEMMVDEAHATGIFGRNGSGVIEEEGLAERIDLIMGTFGKALGSFGAYIASSKKVIDYLINTSRSFIYSTALPPATIAANIAAIGLVKEEPHRRHKLLERTEYFRNTLRSRGFELRGDSQIAPVIVGENKRAVELAGLLQEKGWWVLPIRPPTVPKGEARLRFSLTFYQDEQILDKLINDISRIKI